MNNKGYVILVNVISSLFLSLSAYLSIGFPQGATVLIVLKTSLIQMATIISNFLLSKRLLKENGLQKRELLALNLIDLFLILPIYIEAFKSIVHFVKINEVGLCLLPCVTAISLTIYICLRLVNSFCSYKQK